MGGVGDFTAGPVAVTLEGKVFGVPTEDAACVLGFPWGITGDVRVPEGGWVANVGEGVGRAGLLGAPLEFELVLGFVPETTGIPVVVSPVGDVNPMPG